MKYHKKEGLRLGKAIKCTNFVVIYFQHFGKHSDLKNDIQFL